MSLFLASASLGTALLGLIFPVDSKTNLLHSFMQRIGVLLIAAGIIMILAVVKIEALELITALVILAIGDGLVVWSLYFRYSCKQWRRKQRV